jgi:hypothetical protein
MKTNNLYKQNNKSSVINYSYIQNYVLTNNILILLMSIQMMKGDEG